MKITPLRCSFTKEAPAICELAPWFKLPSEFWKQAGQLEPQGSSVLGTLSWELGQRCPFTLSHGEPHQLCQDRQEDDDGGCVAGELCEEGDDHSDEEHSQHWGHMLQGVQLPTDPR